MSCKKNYLVILQCSYKTGALPSNCNSDSTIKIKCYLTRIWDRAPYSGMVRLVNSSYTGQGIVEVYCHGKWGVVCNKARSSSESFARTACNQLGYNSLVDRDYSTQFSNAFFASIKETDGCGDNDGDFKKCIKDCASCDDNIDSCDNGILNVTCKYDKGTAANHGNKMGACSPINLYPGKLAVTALVLILFLYLYFITRFCIRIITIWCRRRRGQRQPLLEVNDNNEDNNNNNKCRVCCSVICDIFCCN
ncbi:PREDICTED: neurotrypsin-like isoform X2 [Amphimedon queenslandica]|nr:PREDICTED: neurotrypsin-like isoform X2 [Amphimedon queenslandica]|eukprot:XP_019848872.1 PREDICTED: neurotrypsin-like isoform X2 [Amphimedon queenslandica]